MLPLNVAERWSQIPMISLDHVRSRIVRLKERRWTRKPNLWRLAAGVAFGVLGTLGIGLGIKVIVDVHSPVPFADFWSQFPFLERAIAGDWSISELWAQHNEHRILVPRIQFLLDYRFFDGTNVFLFCTIAASLLLLAGTFAAVVWLETHDRLLAWGAFCASAIATMSPAGWENLYWAFQVQFVQVFLFATLAIFAVIVAARSSAPTVRFLMTAACAIAAIAATYSMANGFLVWVVVLLLAVMLEMGLRVSASLAFVGAVTLVSYLWHFEFSTRGSLSDPAGLGSFVGVYLGSALRELGESVSGAVGGVGIGLFVLLVFLAWRHRAQGSIAIPFGAGVGLFVLLTAAQTSAGRLYLGISQALDSRYAIGSFTFWLALLVGFLTPLRERFARVAPICCPAYLGGAALLSLVIGVISLPSGTLLRTLVAGKEVTVVAYLSGVDDRSGTLTGGPSGSTVSSAFRWMERRNLGPWAPGGMAEDMHFTLPSTELSRACRGAIEFVEPVGGGLRLRGWIAPPGGERASRNLAVFDGGSSPRGAGRVGTHRPDVSASGAVSSDWTGFNAYARGNPPFPLFVLLIGDDRTSVVCHLETVPG